MPLIVPYFIALGQTTYEKKRYKNFTLFSIWHSGLNFDNSGPYVQQCPFINLPNFVDFVDGVTNKNVQCSDKIAN